MTCHDLEEKIIGFHFNTLSKTDYDDVAEHVRQCPRCLDKLLLHKRAMDATPEGLQIPQTLNDQVMEHVSLTIKKETQRSSNLWLVAVAACFLGFLSFGVFMENKNHKPVESHMETPHFDKNELVLANFTTT